MLQEDFNVELKAEFSKSFLKTVSAYANYNDGEIIFGVDDDGVVVGVGEAKELCLRIENSINDSVEPLPRYTLRTERLEGRNVVRLKVFRGSDTPYYASGKAYKRSHTATVRVDSSELKHLVLNGMNVSFEERPASDQFLAFTCLDAHLKEKLRLEEIDEKVYRTLELTSPDSGFNNAAAVLADENSFPGIDIVRFGATINDFMDRRRVQNVSALRLYEEAMAMFDRYYRYETVRGMKREIDCLVPESAYREAVVNALVHRAWDVDGMVKISYFDDRIEVVSPGGLPRGVVEEDYLNGRLSVLRNPIIAGVFARLGYIERFGTGIPRIKEAYAESIVRPQFSITFGTIAVTLPVIAGAVDLGSSERAVLELLKDGNALTRVQIEQALGISKSTAFRTLKRLDEEGLIRVEGVGRGTRYRL